MFPSFLCISLSSLRILYSVLDNTIKAQKEDYLVNSWIRIGYNLFQDSKAHPTTSDIIISTNYCSATSPMRTVHQGLPASYYIGKLLCENFRLWTPTDKLLPFLEFPWAFGICAVLRSIVILSIPVLSETKMGKLEIGNTCAGLNKLPVNT